MSAERRVGWYFEAKYLGLYGREAEVEEKMESSSFEEAETKGGEILQRYKEAHPSLKEARLVYFFPTD